MKHIESRAPRKHIFYPDTLWLSHVTHQHIHPAVIEAESILRGTNDINTSEVYNPLVTMATIPYELPGTRPFTAITLDNKATFSLLQTNEASGYNKLLWQKNDALPLHPDILNNAVFNELSQYIGSYITTAFDKRFAVPDTVGIQNLTEVDVLWLNGELTRYSFVEQLHQRLYRQHLIESAADVAKIDYKIGSDRSALNYQLLVDYLNGAMKLSLPPGFEFTTDELGWVLKNHIAMREEIDIQQAAQALSTTINGALRTK